MDADSDRLEELVAACLEREEAEGDAGVAAFLQQHADDAPELKRRLDSLRALGVFGPRESAAEAFPEELGEFRLLRRLGCGGMGVVYLAEQRSLGRTVALKLIRPDNLYFPGALDRFRREVETAARLQHEGIAAIYSVGKEKGIPFFAMERVDGCSIGDVLKIVAGRDVRTLTGADFARAIEASLTAGADGRVHGAEMADAFMGSWVEVCTRFVANAARTLEYVHHQGILHRDLKPSNLMVTRGGRVLLVDFGLASAAGSSHLTRSGSELGSLPYMAPEQTRGDARNVTAKTDVYALGVSLYEMLTLRLPFTGESAEQLRERIRQGGAVNPRERNADISLDTAIVCLKAMEADPRERYASSAEFADDLTNLLERRPIRAKPPGPWIVSRRWVERNPAMAAALTLGFLLVAGTPTALLVQKQSAMTELEGAYRSAREERDRARADFQAAMAAVDQMLTNVAEHKLSEEPRMEGLRRELLQDALDICNGFLERHRSEPAATIEAARAESRLARIERMLGNDKAAFAALNSAIDKLDAAGLTRDAAIQRIHRGRIYNDTAQLDSAEKDFVDAARALEERLGVEPGDSSVSDALSDVKGSHSDLLRASGHTADALSAAERAVKLDRAAVERAPSNPIAKGRLGTTLGRIAGAMDALQRPAEAEAAYADAISYLRECIDGAPVFGFRDILARTQQALGSFYLRKRVLDKAEQQLTDASLTRRKLRDEFPQIRSVRTDLAAVETNLGALAAQKGNVKDAEAAFERAIGEFEWLVERSPDVPDLRHSLAGVLNNLGRVKLQTKDFATAKTILTRAWEVESTAMQKNPNNPKYHDFAQNQAFNLVRCYIALNDLDGASAAARNLHRVPNAVVDDTFVAIGLLVLVYDAERAKGSVKASETIREILDLLRALRDAGTLDSKKLRDTTNFVPLRGDPDFQAFLAELDK